MLLFIADSDTSSKFLQEIGSMLSAEVIVCSGSYGAKNATIKLLRRVNNIRFFRRKKVFKNMSHLLTFNDVAVEDQFALDQAKAIGSEVWLGEDGVAIYETGGSFYEPLHVRWLAKLFYGRWWRQKAKIGMDSTIGNIFAAFPSLVEAHVAQGKNLFPLRNFDHDDYSFLARSCGVRQWGGSRSALVILPVLTESLAKFSKLLCGDLIENEYNVLIKFHPRDSGKYLSDLESKFSEKAYVVPKNIPCELYCMTNDAPNIVVGFRSSALHLIKALAPDTDVRFWESGSERLSIKWKDFYRKVKVEEYRTGG